MIFPLARILSLWLAVSFSASLWAADTSHDVVIIGAGSAGLYAAKTLIAEGYDVLIIEATDRIGGRVYSATLGDIRIELGAEEHYLGTGNNPVWPAVRELYGNAIYTQAYQGAEVYSMDEGTNTCWWAEGIVERNCDDDADIVATEDFNNWYWRVNNHPDANVTLDQAVFEQFDVDANHRAYHLYDQGLAGANYATSLHQIGARSLALQDSQWDLSEDIRVLSDKNLGYLDVLNRLWWNDVVDQADLILESPVVSIDTSGDGVVVTDDQGDQHVANQVIVTVSIGVLQAELIDFIPDLPEQTVNAYQGIGIDMGMKVALEFSEPWWQREQEAMGWLVTEGLAGACWVPSDYKEDSASHILMCYPMGENATQLNELAQHSNDEDMAIVQAVLEDLDSVFSETVTLASESYLNAQVQNWGTAPYTLGAYSYPKIGTYSARRESLRLDLQVPVAENRIFFAGEASHNTHPATVIGALHEGERAALEIHLINLAE